MVVIEAVSWIHKISLGIKERIYKLHFAALGL